MREVDVLSLVTNPRSSRWLGQNRSRFIDAYGIQFWSQMVNQLQQHDKISELPDKYRRAYNRIRRQSRNDSRP